MWFPLQAKGPILLLKEQLRNLVEMVHLQCPSIKLYHCSNHSRSSLAWKTKEIFWISVEGLIRNVNYTSPSTNDEINEFATHPGGCIMEFCQ